MAARAAHHGVGRVADEAADWVSDLGVDLAGRVAVWAVHQAACWVAALVAD